MKPTPPGSGGSGGGTPQIPVTAGGIAFGIAAAGIAGVVTSMASADAGAVAALTAVTTLVAVEAAVARKLRGPHRLATFHAANVATWGAWTVSSLMLTLQVPGDMGLLASLSAAVIGTALIVGRRRVGLLAEPGTETLSD